MAFDVQGAGLLNPVELRRIDSEAINGETRSLGGTSEHGGRCHLSAMSRWEGIPLADSPIELRYSGFVRPVAVECDQRHAAINGCAGKSRPDRSSSRDRDTRRHL